MPCCGDREKGPVSLEEQWDYVNLSDFKSESCLTPFSYFFLWVFLAISLAVYGVDTFTAVNLLAFSRWAGQIEPAIPFAVSRWIFAVCIIISFVLLILRWLAAIRAMRSGSIAQSYLNSLAVRVQSIRMGDHGRGWKRFLVFAELTKSKKGAEYVALFAYFSFETWLTTLFADGPRQVVNAITLYSVMRMDLLPGGEHAHNNEDSPAFIQFFENVKILAEENNLRAVVLFGMLFTLIIWVLSILKLALAIILYLIFLFHHIPSEDGSLKAYCRRKINNRLMRIVRQKVNKALSKGIALQNRAPTQPTLTVDTKMKPSFPAVGLGDDDKGPIVTTISRSTTQTTLPPYSSRPGTAAPDRNPTLPDVGTFDDKPPLSRTITQSSAFSESALSGTTAVSPYSPLDRQTTPAPPVPPLPTHVPLPPSRTQTPMSRSNFTPAPPSSVRGPSRMASANGFRDLNEAHEGYPGYNQQSVRGPSRMASANGFRDLNEAHEGYPGYNQQSVRGPSRMASANGFKDPIEGHENYSSYGASPVYGPNRMASANGLRDLGETQEDHAIYESSYGASPVYGPNRMASANGFRGPSDAQDSYSAYGPSLAHGPGRMASANGFRDQSEAPEGYLAHGLPPVREVNSMVSTNDNGNSSENHEYSAYSVPSTVPYRSYTPAADPTARSRTPGSVMSPNDSVPARTFSPVNQSGGISQQHPGYPPRTYTPFSQVANQPQDSLRSPVGSDAMSSFDPVAPRGPSQPQGQDGYVAFNPSSGTSTTPAGPPTLSSPVQISAEQGNSSLSNDHSDRPLPPARAYSPYTPQPQRHEDRQDRQDHQSYF